MCLLCACSVKCVANSVGFDNLLLPSTSCCHVTLPCLNSGCLYLCFSFPFFSPQIIQLKAAYLFLRCKT